MFFPMIFCGATMPAAFPSCMDDKPSEWSFQSFTPEAVTVKVSKQISKNLFKKEYVW